MVKTAPWLKDLRGTIKRTYGPGWVLEERSGCFKIQRRESGNAREGKRPTITTSIAFAPSSSTEVLVLIGDLKRKMADLGIGLCASHELISGGQRTWPLVALMAQDGQALRDQPCWKWSGQSVHLRKGGTAQDRTHD